jgi:hypothetical protein
MPVEVSMRDHPSNNRQASSRQTFIRQVPGGLVLGGLVLLTVALVAAEALGCPNCKDAVNTADTDGLNLARGYFYSILLMLAMPFTLAGSFGCYVWREMRRQQRDQARVGSDTAPFTSETSDGTSRE